MHSRSLYLKFNLLIVGSIFLCGLFLGGMFLYTMSRSLENGLDRSGQEIGASLGAIISNDILLDDRFAISDRLMKSMEQNAQIRYILVVSPEGEVLASTFPAGLPQGLPAARQPMDGTGIDTISFESNEGRIREILCPIDEGLIGTMRIGMTEKQMVVIMKERCLQIILTVLLICLLASLLATRYARHFLRPVQTMAAAVHQIGTGNYDVSVPVSAQDEIGRLADAFNDMTARLKMKDAENSNLLRALKEKEKARVWLLGQLFSAREDERKRISRELHDETGQSMVSILAYLRVLHDKLDNDAQRELLLGVRELTADTLEGLRRLAVDLHPPMLDDLGLVVAVEKYLETFRKTQPQIDVKMKFVGDFSGLPHTIALVCYRTLQEALTNIVRHARAQHVSVCMEHAAQKVLLEIADDGIGFVRSVADAARRDRHLGLVSMRERVESLNGQFSIDSKLQSGTCITIVLPVQNLAEEGEHDEG